MVNLNLLSHKNKNLRSFTHINFSQELYSIRLSKSILFFYFYNLFYYSQNIFFIYKLCLIQSRFDQFQIYKNIFGFLYNFKKLKALDDDDGLQNKYLNLEGFLLKHDIDGFDLFLELKDLK
jgi:hypothetical protein